MKLNAATLYRAGGFWALQYHTTADDNPFASAPLLTDCPSRWDSETAMNEVLKAEPNLTLIIIEEA